MKRRKTSPINLMVSEETKTRLKQKAKLAGLTLTAYFEKISSESIIFLDENTKTLLSALKLNTKSM